MCFYALKLINHQFLWLINIPDRRLVGCRQCIHLRNLFDIWASKPETPVSQHTHGFLFFFFCVRGLCDGCLFKLSPILPVFTFRTFKSSINAFCPALLIRLQSKKVLRPSRRSCVKVGMREPLTPRVNLMGKILTQLTPPIHRPTIECIDVWALVSV